MSSSQSSHKKKKDQNQTTSTPITTGEKSLKPKFRKNPQLQKLWHAKLS